MPPQIQQRLSIRSQPPQRVIIERGEPVVEECRTAVGEDRRNDFPVANLTRQQRLAPNRFVERERHAIANIGNRTAELIRQNRASFVVLDTRAIGRVETKTDD